MNAATEQAGRHTFLKIVRKSKHHFPGFILKYFTEYKGVLKIADIVQLRQFFQADSLPKSLHIFKVLLTFNFIPERAMKFGLAKKIRPHKQHLNPLEFLFSCTV